MLLNFDLENLQIVDLELEMNFVILSWIFKSEIQTSNECGVYISTQLLILKELSVIHNDQSQQVVKLKFNISSGLEM